MQAATVDAAKVENGSKKNFKNSGIAAIFAAQTLKNMKCEKVWYKFGFL
jgi:hypothetical protein